MQASASRFPLNSNNARALFREHISSPLTSNPGQVAAGAGCGADRSRVRNRRDARHTIREQIIAFNFQRERERDIFFSLHWVGPLGELLMAFGAIWRVTQTRWRHSLLSENLVWSERQVGHLAAAATLAAAPPGRGRDGPPPSWNTPLASTAWLGGSPTHSGANGAARPISSRDLIQIPFAGFVSGSVRFSVVKVLICDKKGKFTTQFWLRCGCGISLLVWILIL